MANSFEKVTIYNKVIDDALEANLTSQALTANSSLIQYSGGDTVKIGVITTDGMGDYDRQSGFPSGSAALTWENYQIRHDRGVSFAIDVMDQDETAGIMTTGAVMANFAKYNEVPEIDAVRYSSIWEGIIDDTTVRYGFLTAAAATLLTQIKTDIAAMRDKIGETEQLVLYMSGTTYGVLSNSTEMSKQLEITTLPIQGINTQVRGIDRVPIIAVPSSRFKTEYQLKPGDVANNFGFTARPWARQMDYILMATSSAVAFDKHAKVRYFSADVNQTKDADKVDMRLFYDCWVMKNKRTGIFVRLESGDIAGIEDVFGSGSVVSGTGKVTVTLGDYFDLLPDGYKVYAIDTGSATAPTAPAAYDDYDITGYTEITAKTATDITATASDWVKTVLVTDDGKVVAYDQRTAL